MLIKLLSCIALLIVPTTAARCNTTSDLYQGICSTGANLVIYVKIGNKRGEHPVMSERIQGESPFFYYHGVESYSVIKARYGGLLKRHTFISVKNITCRYCYINFEVDAWYIVAGQYFGGSYLWMDPHGYSEKWKWFLLWKVWAIESLPCLS